MISHLDAEHPGLSVSVDLRGLASSHVSGPSGSGKSTLAAALDTLLTGEGRPGWSVSGSTARGTLLAVDGRSRRVTPAGSPTPAVYRSADEYRTALWRRPMDPTIIRLILHAETWTALYATPRARGLRDALLSVVPAGDLRAVVAETMGAHELRADDPLHLDDVGERGKPKTPGALSRQTAANAARDRAAGALTALRASLASAEAAIPPVPDAADREAAETALSLVGEWERYDAAMSAHLRDDAAREKAVAAQHAWDVATEAAGSRPEYDAARAHRVRTELGEARAALRAEELAAARAQAEAETAARLAAIPQPPPTPPAEPVSAPAPVVPAAPSPSPSPLPLLTPTRQPSSCPTCGQPWNAP